MWIILAFFGGGLVCGIILKKQSRLVKAAEKLTQVALWMLLFFMGITIGFQEELLRNISSLGLEGALFGLGAVAGSILIIYPISNYVMRSSR